MMKKWGKLIIGVFMTAAMLITKNIRQSAGRRGTNQKYRRKSQRKRSEQK